jgi:hypothetical protein
VAVGHCLPIAFLFLSQEDGVLTDIRWAIDGVLARSSRAGYPSHRVEKATVDEWLARVEELGVRGILCLLSDEQLAYYKGLPDGLLGYYRQRGYVVEHIPIEDPAYHPEGYDQLVGNREQICTLFDRLPKPVLVHCSAGIDRTGHAVLYLEDHLEKQQGKRQKGGRGGG